MKNLLISLSIISSVLISQSVLASEEITSAVEPINVETIVVTSKPEVANFEIYSLDITADALDSVMEIVVDNLSGSITNSGISLAQTAASLGNSI